MPENLANTVQATPLIRCDVPRRMAKADLTFREKRQQYGQILKRASELAGLNQDETAAALGVNRSQISRWWTGEENAQAWRYNAHEQLRLAYLVAQAEAHENGDAIVVETVVKVRRQRA